MTSTRPGPDAPVQRVAPSSRTGVLIAAGLGLGYLPLAPGTWGSLVSVLLFVPVYYWLEGAAQWFTYLVILLGLTPVALWSIERALEHWKGTDPQPIVIDEIVGQWVAYAGIVAANAGGLPVALAEARWKYLLMGFILFRVFDVAKPFPIRRSERWPGAAGVLLDDLLAGVYASGGVLLAAWAGWLT